MNPRLAINGYGRIGRCFLRALLASPLRECLSVVAINEPANIDSMAYLTRFDSTHGSFPGVVRARNGCLEIDGRDIAVSHATTPDGVDWQSHGVDLLIEASGRYSRREDLEKFLHTGCPRLLLSQPGASADDVDRTLVFGFNHETLGDADRIVSAGSCTTNALVPILSILDENFGVEHAIATTMHSVMNDQPLIDGYHPNDLRMTRSAMQSMIPVETGLARGVARFLPALESRITAKAIREANDFNFFAINEVGCLFVGIFITMQVPVEILNLKGPELGLQTPVHFFWATGMLSSFLDNAPTYVVFFQTAGTLPWGDSTQLMQGVQTATGTIPIPLLVSISIGAVFMGANTYIGNGPNFMVKSIAEQAGVKMPSFFGYMVYSVGVLIPVFILVTFVFMM